MNDSHSYCGAIFQVEMSSLGPENWCLLQNVIRYEQKQQQSFSFFFYFLVMTEISSKFFLKVKGEKSQLNCFLDDVN